MEARSIEVQLTEGNQSSIASGLKSGETVVTDGIDKLGPGTKVNVRPPNARS
jgi:multidrug efflux pump subunit AcrA (membrane-fusion protein)